VVADTLPPFALVPTNGAEVSPASVVMVRPVLPEVSGSKSLARRLAAPLVVEMRTLPKAVKVSARAMGCVWTEPGTSEVLGSPTSLNWTPVASASPVFVIVTV
jgi:hypothetical protein